MIQLNLLPDVKKEFLKSQKTKALVISSSILITLGAVVVVVLLFIYTTVVQQLQINLLTDDIKNKSNQVNNIEDISKYLTIQNQLKVLPGLHEQKGAYSRLFTILPVVNPSAPNNIKLSVLNLTIADKTILLNGTTASFESLKVFVDTLSNVEATYTLPDSDETKTEKVFDSVVVQNSSLSRLNNVSAVSFAIKLTYRESVFDARNSNVNAKVPNIQTTQSFTNAPNPQLFEEGGQ